MSENETKVAKFQPVTYEEVVDFFDRKNVRTQCEVCGETAGWTVTSSSQSATGNIDRYFGVVTVDSNGGIYPSGSVPLIVCSCNSCGYIRFHAANIVRKRFDALQSAENSEQLPEDGVL